MNRIKPGVKNFALGNNRMVKLRARMVSKINNTPTREKIFKEMEFQEIVQKHKKHTI